MKVQSSTISEINHNGKVLIVTFVNGSEYVYEDVPTKIYEAFVNAESKGKYFHENISRQYKYLRVK